MPAPAAVFRGHLAPRLRGLAGAMDSCTRGVWTVPSTLEMARVDRLLLQNDGWSEAFGRCTTSVEIAEGYHKAVYPKGVRADRDILRDMAGEGVNKKGRSPPRAVPEPRSKVACLATLVPACVLMLVNPGPLPRLSQKTEAGGMSRYAETRPLEALLLRGSNYAYGPATSREN